MSKRREFECQFGIGQPDGNHSMVWKVWANRRKADVYVTARAMGHALKASIHAGAARQFGFTREYVAEALARKEWQGGSRHYDRWVGGYPLEQGASLEFAIRFPTSELRAFPLREQDLKNTVWLSPAPETEAVEVQLIFLPLEALRRGAQPAFTDESTELVCTGRLVDGRHVWLVSRTVPITIRPEAFQEIAGQMQGRGIAPAALHDGVRLTVTSNDFGVRGWTELAMTRVVNAMSSRPKIEHDDF
jgi:hypothetical protein